MITVAGRRVAHGTAVLAVLAAALVAVVTRGSGPATAAAPPLSQQDRQVLAASRGLVTSLPAALRELPRAASDASGGRVSSAQARSLIMRTHSLEPLARAIADPDRVTKPLMTAYAATVAGRSPGSIDVIAPAVQQLQTVESQLEPAIRLVAARSGQAVSTDTMAAGLDSDQKVIALGGVLTHWSQVYGALVLVEQSAAG